MFLRTQLWWGPISATKNPLQCWGPTTRCCMLISYGYDSSPWHSRYTEIATQLMLLMLIPPNIVIIRFDPSPYKKNACVFMKNLWTHRKKSFVCISYYDLWYDLVWPMRHIAGKRSHQHNQQGPHLRIPKLARSAAAWPGLLGAGTRLQTWGWDRSLTP